MQQSPGKFLFIFAIATMLGACGPSADSLRRALEAGKYRDAVLFVRGDARGERLLASQILAEGALADADKAFPHIVLLRAGKRIGKARLRELKRTASDPSTKALATLALDSRFRLSQRELEPYLSSEWSDVREYAVASGRKQLSQARLLPLMEDINPAVRRRTVEALCSRPRTDRSLGVVRDRLRLDPDPFVRTQAARCALLKTETAVPWLIDALADANTGVQAAAISTLAQIGGRRATEKLLQITRGPMTEAGVLCAVALSLEEVPEGLRRFRDALVDDNPTIRAIAVVQLSRVAVADAASIRLAMLLDQSAQVQFLVASSILSSGNNSAKASAVLKALWQEGGPFADLSMRRLAASGNKDALAFLVGELQRLSGENPRATAAIISACSENPALRKDFVDFMGHADCTVRIAAATAVFSL